MNLRRTERSIAATLFVAYAWFHQGGGWNQNSRFDQVRAIVESGRLSIDDYLTYASSTVDGRTVARRLPPAEAAKAAGSAAAAHPVANTGDVSSFAGLTYPNKPPGATFLAVPAYLAIASYESLARIDPDDFWAGNLNLYLTTVLSIGILAALGGVLFFRISRSLFPGTADTFHALSTIAFGLGTLYFPFSTMLFDHVPVAVLSLLAFAMLRDGSAKEGRAAAGRLIAAGGAAGLAVLCNYAAALIAAPLVVYAFIVCRPRRRVFLVLAGGLPAALALGWYQAACFGSPLALATSFQSGLFTTTGARWLGAFDPPRGEIVVRLLIDPYRGLFISSPILFLGVYGLWRMAGTRSTRTEAVLFASIATAFLLMNASFNGWHGGYSFGPRYLIPALPFLALPLAPVLARLKRIGWCLVVISAALILLATAVDPQAPFDIPNPWTGYIVPLATGGSVPRPPHRIEGRVSANPQGTSEKFAFDLFRPGSEQVAWNSFNLGEILWPGSAMSLLPLLVALGFGARAILARPEPPRPGAPAAPR